jgi:hypothetical protein
MSDMVNNDLEKFAKALDKYVIRFRMLYSLLDIFSQRNYEISFTQDGGS